MGKKGGSRRDGWREGGIMIGTERVCVCILNLPVALLRFRDKLH